MGDDDLLSCRIKKRYAGFFDKLFGSISEPIALFLILLVTAGYITLSSYSMLWAWNPVIFTYDKMGVFGACCIVALLDAVAVWFGAVCTIEGDSPVVVYCGLILAIFACISAMAKIVAALTYAGWIAGVIAFVIIACIWAWVVIVIVCECQKQIIVLTRRREREEQEMKAKKEKGG